MTVSRLSRLGRWALLVAPSVSVVLLDVALRGPRMQRFDTADWLNYALTLFESLVLWGTLLWGTGLASRPARWFVAVLFVLFFGIALGGQAYFFEQYGAYLTVGIARFATDFRESVVNQLLADAGNYLSFKGPALILAFGLWSAFALWTRQNGDRGTVPRFWVPLCLALIATSLFVPVNFKRRQPSTPDVLYMNAVGEMLFVQLGLSEESGKQHPRLRAPLPVPRLSPRPARPRNVVLVLLESVRKDAVCNAYHPACEKTPYTNRLFPERVALSQMRALDSCTAISMAVLYSGLGPHENREALHSFPFVFDYARAAGFDTAYFTSQNILFGNMRLWLGKLGVRHFFSALDVDSESDIDMGAPEKQFAQLALDRLHRLREPFFLTIQLSNGHYPYFVDPEGPQPFQPASTSKDPEEGDLFFNHYKNAVHQEDQHLAHLLKGIRALESGERTVILMTSDHGEAFREHQQMGHTLSLFDEELLVPAWIHAPVGTLDAAEQRALEANRTRPTFHPDLTATVLDLMGIWDNEKLKRFQSRMLGSSLLRGEVPIDRVVPLSNCAPVWSCAFENWGVMRGQMKLHAREWDSDYRCFNLAIDPVEARDLGSAACGDLSAHARRLFPRLPGKGQ